MKRFLVLILLISLKSFSQNLIPNSDFESKIDCPSALGEIEFAKGWISPNNGTPDYFNDCSTSFNFGTEFNKKGGQIPRSGHGYGGIQINNLHKNLHYEYLETELTSPLQSGKLYCIKMYVSLGNSDCAVNELGAIISQNLLKSTDPGKFNLPFMHLVNENQLTDSLSWICVKGVYTAKGNEKFLTFGFFGNDEDFIRLRLDPKSDSSFYTAYYFIDDVSLEAITNIDDCNCQK
jgi:OmpA-OmpF porin, OOP family